MIICGVAELVSLASVIPFLLVLTDPARLINIPILRSSFLKIGIENTPNLLVFVTSLFIFAAFLSMLFRLLNLWMNGQVAAGIGSDLSSRVYTNILYKPYSWHINNNSSQIINDTTNNVAFTIAYLNSSLRILTLVIVVLFLISGLVAVNWKIALLCFVTFSTAYFFLAIFVRKRFSFNGRILVNSYKEQLKTLQEGLGSIRDVILGNNQNYFTSIYKKIDKPIRFREAQNDFLKASPRFSLESISLFLIALIAYYLTKEGVESSTIISLLGTFALGSQRLLPAMQGIYNDWANLRSFAPGVQSVLSLLSISQDKTRKLIQSQRSFKFTNSILLRDVDFCYSNSSNKVLNKINLEIRKGEKIGFVGKTGCGKSTLLDLIMGLLQPTNGHIKVDGSELSNSNPLFLSQWRASISNVPQRIYLADSSILQNIAFGVDPTNINKEKVFIAAKKAQISSFIETLPNGYNTTIGERGVKLSGGQCQRLAIARALYKESNVLIFDEATSALDDSTESSLIDTVYSLSEGLTLLMIAHRITTLKRCDKIYELSNFALKQIVL